MGCLLPFTGLLGVSLPLILIAALIYYLVSRRPGNPAGPVPPTNPGAGFCTHCGHPVTAGVRFCAGCGRPIEQG